MSEHLATDPVTVQRCRRCQAPILVGLAEGLPCRVDPVAVNQLGELIAILGILATFTLTKSGLVQRDASRVRGTFLRGPVLVQHQCGRHIPADHRATPAAPALVPAHSGPFPF
ncbi:MAG TPA: hypothetical protein VK453_24460 [Micromonosporaceae bacterium]|nr:hypothetical protein [Micromonosporaceae bacterium]